MNCEKKGKKVTVYLQGKLLIEDASKKNGFFSEKFIFLRTIFYTNSFKIAFHFCHKFNPARDKTMDVVKAAIAPVALV
jgi:hypothetical protein